MSDLQKTSTDPLRMIVNTSCDLGKVLRTARKSASLRVVDAAQLSGVAIQTLVDIEAGRSGVSIGKIMQVADALGICLFAVPAKERQRVQNMLLDAASLENRKHP